MKFIKTTIVLSILTAGMVCVSCDDDDDDNNAGGGSGNGTVTVDVNSVFTNGMPKAVDNIQSITFNDKGLVSSMTTEDAKVTFEYINMETRSTDKTPKVRMTLTEGEDYYSVLDMTIGKNGYVDSVFQTSHDPYDGMQTDYWQFRYNDAGQLNYMKRSEGGNEETFITYKNGDITAVRQTSEDEEEEDWSQNILYTSQSVTSPIDNKGCLMLFDDTFGIDMDEMKYAYYAGLLGKATRHLPVGCRDEEDTEYYDWNINSNGYPTSVTIDGETLNFKW